MHYCITLTIPDTRNSIYDEMLSHEDWLSTPPRDDAVTFGYGVLAYPDTDFHRADVTPLRAHSSPRPAGSTLGVRRRESSTLIFMDSRLRRNDKID